MRFLRRSAISPTAHVGLFPGTFNPPTVAHLRLAQAALRQVEEVVFVLPRVFPHKHYSGATFEQRLELLDAALALEPRTSIASTSGGLFIDMAREAREHFGSATHLSFLCGRDAAERIATWDYGRPGAWEEMLREFTLLVASRQGEYRPDPAQLGSFGTIPMDPACDATSASEVRRRIAAGEPWEHLVPATIVRRVREIYTEIR